MVVAGPSSEITGAQNAKPTEPVGTRSGGDTAIAESDPESGEQMHRFRRHCSAAHGVLYRYMPQNGGHWKATNNDIIERHADGTSRIRFRPVAAHLTPMAMTDLITRYRTALDQHLADPLVLVPLVIPTFSASTPFQMATVAWHGY